MSYDKDGSIIEWIWTFNDNESIEAMNTVHRFATEGVYTVTLTVVDNEKATNSTTIDVIVESLNTRPSQPVINGSKSLEVNVSYVFNFNSYDLENDMLLFSVDWGDESSSMSTFTVDSCALEHVWSKKGNFTVEVKVFDGQLYSESAFFEINVHKPEIQNNSILILFIIAMITFILLAGKTSIDEKKSRVNIH